MKTRTLPSTIACTGMAGCALGLLVITASCASEDAALTADDPARVQQAVEEDGESSADGQPVLLSRGGYRERARGGYRERRSRVVAEARFRENGMTHWGRA